MSQLAEADAFATSCRVLSPRMVCTKVRNDRRAGGSEAAKRQSQLDKSDRGRLPFALIDEKATFCDVHHIASGNGCANWERGSPDASR